jgi:hypothetical protein
MEVTARHGGLVSGVGNTLSSCASFALPLWVGFLINNAAHGSASSAAWRPVFACLVAVLCAAAALFCSLSVGAPVDLDLLPATAAETAGSAGAGEKGSKKGAAGAGAAGAGAAGAGAASSPVGGARAKPVGGRLAALKKEAGGAGGRGGAEAAGQSPTAGAGAGTVGTPTRRSKRSVKAPELYVASPAGTPKSKKAN